MTRSDSKWNDKVTNNATRNMHYNDSYNCIFIDCPFSKNKNRLSTNMVVVLELTQFGQYWIELHKQLLYFVPTYFRAPPNTTVII